MKPSKEAIFGVIAALQARHELNQAAWEQEQLDKVIRLVDKPPACQVSAPRSPGPTDCRSARTAQHRLRDSSATRPR